MDATSGLTVWPTSSLRTQLKPSGKSDVQDTPPKQAGYKRLLIGLPSPYSTHDLIPETANEVMRTAKPIMKDGENRWPCPMSDCEMHYKHSSSLKRHLSRVAAICTQCGNGALSVNEPAWSSRSLAIGGMVSCCLYSLSFSPHLTQLISHYT
ncbi:hypothetical protein EXIGLDRAFT_706814 [Exidia glandulosa HHB12029]|uniref:C2H2-type domain-containing protein n=1 Tax=Exidia glandulosa HHB12029 TaxID=1314781 RepID=A0A165K4G5_EXIGL|nr:hypothetical protein EXIGLDRAFT_706814 [Exidia glandulosa HHB12029]